MSARPFHADFTVLTGSKISFVLSYTTVNVVLFEHKLGYTYTVLFLVLWFDTLSIISIYQV